MYRVIFIHFIWWYQVLVCGIGEKKCWITSRNQIAGLASPGTTTYILNVCTHGEQLNSIENSKRREKEKKALSNVAEAIKVTRCYNKWLAMNGPPLHKQLRLYSFASSLFLLSPSLSSSLSFSFSLYVKNIINILTHRFPLFFFALSLSLFYFILF